MSKSKRVVALLLAIGALAMSAPAAWAAPGPGDQQCRGANGNGNPHCPPAK